MPRLIVLAALVLLAAVPGKAADPAPVEAEIARAARQAGGVVGVAAWRLDGRGPRILVNSDQRFPMASTFKVAVAGAVLAKVDRGELSLDRLVAIDPGMVVESMGIAEIARHPGMSLSVANLLELMMTVSDNTATDVLTGLAGGPAAVTAWVRSQGVKELRVDRDTAGIIRDFFGIGPGPFPQALDAARKANPDLEELGSRLNARFDEDERDTASPLAMAALLDGIFSGRALKPSSTKLLTEIMERNRTGTARIRGRLPEGTVVAEKTGTIGGSLNDVGLITLPGTGGKVVLAVFIRKSPKAFEERERAIADIGRAVYDYYLFGPDK